MSTALVFAVFCLCWQNPVCVFVLFRHSFEYLLNFRSTVPSLSIALCLSQLLSTVSEKGGNPAAYREQTGQSDMLPHLNQLFFFSDVTVMLIFFFSFRPSFTRKTFPESRVGDSQRREGAREQIQWSPSLCLKVCLHAKTMLLKTCRCVSVRGKNKAIDSFWKWTQLDIYLVQEQNLMLLIFFYILTIVNILCSAVCMCVSCRFLPSLYGSNQTLIATAVAASKTPWKKQREAGLCALPAIICNSWKTQCVTLLLALKMFKIFQLPQTTKKHNMREKSTHYVSYHAKMFLPVMLI